MGKLNRRTEDDVDELADEITKEIESAVKNKTLLSLVDEKGRKILVPGESLAFVEIGASEQRRVGFAG
jgi:hypothetical protein